MLEIKNVTKKFNLTGTQEDERIALDNVSLSVAPGEFVTIIGGNGSGKSTLMNIIAGTLSPDSGQVFINGKDVTKLKEHQRAEFLGRVFQDPMRGTAADMSVLENLEIARIRGKKHSPLKWGFSIAHKEEFIKELQRFHLGLEDRLNQKVGLLSGGQRQALTLLMASMIEPKILLLDEHTAALDPKTAQTVLTLTDDIVKENKLTTLMITHNMRDAITYGDRVIMLHNGKIIFDVKGKEKKKLTVDVLYKLFEEASLASLK